MRDIVGLSSNNSGLAKIIDHDKKIKIIDKIKAKYRALGMDNNLDIQYEEESGLIMFNGMDNSPDMVIPNGVEKIGELHSNVDVHSIKFPDSLKVIGRDSLLNMSYCETFDFSNTLLDLIEQNAISFGLGTDNFLSDAVVILPNRPIVMKPWAISNVKTLKVVGNILDYKLLYPNSINNVRITTMNKEDTDFKLSGIDIQGIKSPDYTEANFQSEAAQFRGVVFDCDVEIVFGYTSKVSLEFKECSFLNTVSIARKNSKVKTIYSWIKFNSCSIYRIYLEINVVSCIKCNCCRINKVESSEDIVSIGPKAFMNTSINKADFSQAEHISNEAFFGAVLNDVKFGGKIKLLCAGCFEGAVINSIFSLRQEKLNYIGGHVFRNSSLVVENIDNGIEVSSSFKKMFIDSFDGMHLHLVDEPYVRVGTFKDLPLKEALTGKIIEVIKDIRVYTKK